MFSVYIYRIFHILDTVPTIPIEGGIWPQSTTAGEVSFKDISFAYPTRADVDVLTGFSLLIRPKQTIALVGTSGSGEAVSLWDILLY